MKQQRGHKIIGSIVYHPVHGRGKVLCETINWRLTGPTYYRIKFDKYLNSWQEHEYLPSEVATKPPTKGATK